MIREEDKTRLIRNAGLVREVRDTWAMVFGRLSFAGFGRDKLYAGFDEQYGRGNWLPAHFFDGRAVSRYQGYLEYEDAYYHFLKDRSDIRAWIQNAASEVYDLDPSNVQSGLDYTAQECAATHLQDISVRRVLTRLELEERGMPCDPENLPEIKVFHGDHLVQIRGHTTEGFMLNPGQVPFHEPERAIGQYDENAWWLENSAEDVYQRNKVLLISPEHLELRLALVTAETVYLADDAKNCYALQRGNPNHLFYGKGREVRRLAHSVNFDGYCEITRSPVQTFPELQAAGLCYLELRTKRAKKKLSYDEFMAQLPRAP